MDAEKNIAAIEMFDAFRWEERNKIITRDVHGVGGLMNFTHINWLGSRPASPLHYHGDVMEIHCIIKGRRDTKVYVDGSWEEHVQTGGEAFVVFPGELHVTSTDRHQGPCELYAVQLNLAEADDFLGLNPERGRALCRRLLELKSRHVRLGPDELNLLREAFQRIGNRNPIPERDAGVAHLLCFLYRFLTLSPAPAPVKAPSDERILSALRYIDENLVEPLPLEALAGVTGYSLSRFKSKFREEVGQTPAAYITTVRVERAKEALERDDTSITDIAYNLGWSSSNYFCAVFKKLTGVSPLQYRRQNRGDGPD